MILSLSDKHRKVYEKKDEDNVDSDDLLDQTFNLQDQIHHKCKMRDDPVEKQKKWNEKYGKKA